MLRFVSSCVIKLSACSHLILASHASLQEDPFGHDESDLPLEKFCEEVDKQITAVGERAKLITFDLAYGPASHIPSERSSSYSTFPNRRGSPLANGDNDIESGQMSSETDRLVPAQS